MKSWKSEIKELGEIFSDRSSLNYISESLAISPNLAGSRIFQRPLFAFGSASDPLFSRMKDRSVIGEHLMIPQEWLSEAKTVISFFLPFTEEIKDSNRVDMSWPSNEWLHGRIEGQLFVNSLSSHINDKLIKSGYKSIVPSADGRFTANTGDPEKLSYEKNCGISIPPFSSNWSERHAAYVCGLGTFGLSKGLITEKGIAGRFGSILTELDIDPDTRAYEGIYDYCTNCGICAVNCPAGAITIENGKDHQLCSRFLDMTMEKHNPRYGCGKCQVGVPCESSIP